MYIFFKKKTSDTLINIGTGTDKSITEYAKLIMDHLGVKFKIIIKKKTQWNYEKSFRRFFS